MSEQNQPVAGKVVEGATGAVEKVANQVEGAVVSATEFASDNVAGRAIGWAQAGVKILAAGAEGGIAFTKETAENFLATLDEVREKAEQAIKDAAGEGK